MSPEHHGPAAGNWYLLLSTNRGLEEITIQELDSLVDADAEVHYPGMVRCEASEAAVYRIHARARSVHRVHVELARGTCDGIREIYELARELEIPRYLGPEQSFAVRAKRRGDQSFTSVDVEREVGQAIVDEYRSRKRTRPPVDLDDPAVIFRVFVRGETVTVTIDATGQHSLHRRRYRVQGHESPLRPTMAYAMCQYAGYEADDRLVDPMCGCGTIPIEAARAVLSRPPRTAHEPALTRLIFLDAEQYEDHLAPASGRGVPTVESLDITGFDIERAAIGSARENAREANVADALDFETADATERPIAADVVATDMPFGIRTDEKLHPLYTGFFEQMERADWRRLVVHTARPELVPLESAREIEMRRGRLETSMLVFE